MNWTTWNRYLYAVWAPFYDQLMAVLDDKRKRSLQVANVQPSERTLLLGAGTGLDLEYLPRDARVTAIDITPAMIKRLKRRANRLNMQVDARLMDGQKLEFDDDSFDIVILHFVLAVIPDPIKTLQEATRVLRPNGRIVILNKFMRDAREPSFAIQLVNRITKLVATDITFKLNPVLQNADLRPIHIEPVGLGGFFKIAILEKDPQHSKTSPLTDQTQTQPQRIGVFTPLKPEPANASI